MKNQRNKSSKVAFQMKFESYQMSAKNQSSLHGGYDPWVENKNG